MASPTRIEEKQRTIKKTQTKKMRESFLSYRATGLNPCVYVAPEIP